ncbi:unnamed protein product [Amoebophrya sp. A25]|nr:unnamed protein product [Amoebophrya sp. A25]|eukprot:GSA25T00002177001.1
MDNEKLCLQTSLEKTPGHRTAHRRRRQSGNVSDGVPALAVAEGQASPRVSVAKLVRRSPTSSRRLFAGENAHDRHKNEPCSHPRGRKASCQDKSSSNFLHNYTPVLFRILLHNKRPTSP